MRMFSIMHFVPKMAHYARHPEKYSEKKCYDLALDLMDRVRRTARITTSYYGKENLPKKGGYVMFSNHQGKYDALGIMLGHENPCSVLMDMNKSKVMVSKQFVDLVKGVRIEKNKPKQQIRALRSIANQVKEGRKFLVFPEGGYGKKTDNSMGEFKEGCFYCAAKAKCPIVPVAIIDSYKPFSQNSLKKVKTKVIYLKPIEYEEYKDLKIPKLSSLVKSRIEEALKKYSK